MRGSSLRRKTLPEPVVQPGANSITAELLIKLQRRWPQSMFWRNNSGRGLGWSVAKAVIACLRRNDIPTALTLLTRPISFGMIGSPDVIGLIGPHGTFLGIEIKVNDRQSPEQVAFELRSRGLGGIYLICHSVDDCLDELELELTLRAHAGRAA